MVIEKNFDISFIADLALREKQIQQNYRPIIAVHKWFARRPGTLFRGLLLAEFTNQSLAQTFYQANDLRGIKIADPFMGGGTPLIEANRVGCEITGFDINPMAYWIVKQEIEHLDLADYDRAANTLLDTLAKEVGRFYQTRCTKCGDDEASVKYFLWVKTGICRECGKDFDLFPGYLVAADSRHPQNVIYCPSCHRLNEKADRKNPGSCNHCGVLLSIVGPAKRNRCSCPGCGHLHTFPGQAAEPPRHRLFALEYHCPKCKAGHTGRFFKTPDHQDLALLRQAEEHWHGTTPRHVPDDLIPTGDETNRLLRWGYRYYREMFNPRQLLGLERAAAIIAALPEERVRNALATNFSDLLRYQNMLCRYDTTALKSLDIFSVHGFPVGLVHCESNLLGILDSRRKACVGSGGWLNIIEKFRKAKKFCDHPFEVRHLTGKKEIVPIAGEWIGDEPNGRTGARKRKVQLHCRDAALTNLPPSSLDAVFTDPPYFGNVQYAELMDFCYVWLRRLAGAGNPAFAGISTRNAQELTGNNDMKRGIDHFTQGLSAVLQKMALALKPGAPLAFTYHHNDIKAYYPLAVAILDSGLTCSATLPCPAEMGASIHISGTGSSIVDTIFVCRSTGTVPRHLLVDSIADLAPVIEEDLAKLRAGKVKPSKGDIRCISYGHLIRMAIWNLRHSWDRQATVGKRLTTVAQWLANFGSWSEVEKLLFSESREQHVATLPTIREGEVKYESAATEIPF